MSRTIKLDWIRTTKKCGYHKKMAFELPRKVGFKLSPTRKRLYNQYKP